VQAGDLLANVAPPDAILRIGTPRTRRILTHALLDPVPKHRSGYCRYFITILIAAHSREAWRAGREKYAASWPSSCDNHATGAAVAKASHNARRPAIAMVPVFELFLISGILDKSFQMLDQKIPRGEAHRQSANVSPDAPWKRQMADPIFKPLAFPSQYPPGIQIRGLKRWRGPVNRSVSHPLCKLWRRINLDQLPIP
jgi:hypothetical protein